MSGAKYTPGPWRINKWSETAVEGLSGRGVCSTGGYADTFSNGAFHDENEANAHLIAAAPELLEALEQIRNYETAWKLLPTSIADPVLAALAKAKGGDV